MFEPKLCAVNFFAALYRNRPKDEDSIHVRMESSNGHEFVTRKGKTLIRNCSRWLGLYALRFKDVLSIW